MTAKKLKIVFMGTPEFAVTILSEILSSKHQIVGVVTAPDKPAGRGRKINESAVKIFAKEKELRILQPTNLKDSEFNTELLSLNADIFVVVAFRMLPKIVWSMPELGTINLHASLLPDYRGAAPINWAIINGETKTGVTTFFIEEKIDTGEIIEQEAINIAPNETVGILHDRLMELGAKTVISTLNKICSGDYESISQSTFRRDESKVAPKIFKNDCKINFTKPSHEIHNFCRGLDPYPGAWTEFIHCPSGERKKVKLFGSELTDIRSTSKEISLFEDKITFSFSDYVIAFKYIQMEGKRKMSIDEFSAGNSINDYNLIF